MSDIVRVTELVDGVRNGLLFICVANSARSQMAEGLARFLAPSHIKVYSAGSQPTQVHELAVKVMNEIGIDISKQVAKSMDTIPMERVAVVIPLCAEEECPALPSTVTRIDMPVEDPIIEDEDDLIHDFRAARDEIRELVSTLF